MPPTSAAEPPSAPAVAVADAPAPSSQFRAEPAQAPVVSTGPATTGGAEWNVHSSLELLEELYNYNHWLFNKVRPFLRGHVCEVGSGTGKVTQFLLNHERVVGIEPFACSLQTARQRFAQHLNVEFVCCRLEDCPNEQVPAHRFDTVACLNVLEHIRDDVGALVSMRRLLRPRGRGVVLVPAHMSIYGQIDLSFGHYRRYTRRALRLAFAQAGLRVTYNLYLNAFGWFGWLWHSRIRRRTQIPLAAARTFNRLVPFIDVLERVLPPPFGQSLVMVGRPR